MGEDCGEGLLSIVFWCSEPAVCGAGGGEECMWWGGRGRSVHVGRKVEEGVCMWGGEGRGVHVGGGRMCVWRGRGKRVCKY